MSEINMEHPMTQAFGNVEGIANHIEKLAPEEQSPEEITSFLSETVPKLFDSETALGKYLAGDALLAEHGFAEITHNDPDLQNLVGLRLAADALHTNDPSEFIENSGLQEITIAAKAVELQQIFEVTLGSKLFTNTQEGETFGSKLNDSLRTYREKGLMHATPETVSSAIETTPTSVA